MLFSPLCIYLSIASYTLTKHKNLFDSINEFLLELFYDGTRMKVQFAKLDEILSFRVCYKTKHPTVWAITIPLKYLASCYRRSFVSLSLPLHINCYDQTYNTLVDNS